MRFSITLISLLLFAVTLAAQSVNDSNELLKPGVTFGGSLSFDNEKQDENTKSNSFSILPYMMTRVSDHWQLGLCLGYGRSKSYSQRFRITSSSPISSPFRESMFSFGDHIIFFEQAVFDSIIDVENTATEFSTCFFGRFTINPENSLSVFLEPGAALGRGKYVQEVFSSSNSKLAENDKFSKQIDLGSRFGLTYTFNAHWRLTAFVGSLGYNFTYLKDDKKDEFELLNKGASFNLSLRSIRFGVEYTL